MNNNTLKPIKITSDDLILIKKLEKEYEEKKKIIIDLILKEIKEELKTEKMNRYKILKKISI